MLSPTGRAKTHGRGPSHSGDAAIRNVGADALGGPEEKSGQKERNGEFVHIVLFRRFLFLFAPSPRAGGASPSPAVRKQGSFRGVRRPPPTVGTGDFLCRGATHAVARNLTPLSVMPLCAMTALPGGASQDAREGPLPSGGDGRPLRLPAYCVRCRPHCKKVSPLGLAFVFDPECFLSSRPLFYGRVSEWIYTSKSFKAVSL